MFADKMRESKNYKRYIGDDKKYDIIGNIVFDLLKKQGLKKTNHVLDIGCGSLRVGKHLIPYLNKNRYYGLEPETWLVHEAVRNELEDGVSEAKSPIFSNNTDFDIKIFEKSFNVILANSVFIHASLNQIEKTISQISDVLKDNGMFIFNFFVGKDNEKKEFTYPSSVTYTKQTIESILEKYELKYEYITCQYPGKQTWIKVTK